MSDNRKYIYNSKSFSKRNEYGQISKWIDPKARVVDLGCGDGSLLKLLKDERGATGLGVEVSKSGVMSTQKKGIKAIVGKVDEKLPFKDREFDYAICNVTIQMVMFPEILMHEMSRISKKQIITFPNFAFLMNRIDLLVNGVMPRVMIPGYKWYSTGHIHQLSIRDFENFCKELGIKIIDRNFIGPEKVWLFPNIFLPKLPNLFATTGIYLTSQK